MSKPPSASAVEMTQLVMPSDSNSLGTAFGGKIMQWVDMAAGVAARRHAGGIAVTASIDGLQFQHPVRLGDVIVLRAAVNRAWHTSMEVGVRVECEPLHEGDPFVAARAYLTFVAVDEAGQPRDIPAVEPVSEQERRRYDQAQQRREIRLKALPKWNGPEPSGLDDAVDRVVGRLAHDLNNPLSVVMSNLRFLEGSLADAELKQAAEESAVSAERLAYMIDAAAALAPLRGGRFQLEVTDIDICQIRDNIARSVQARLGSRRLEWQVDAARALTDGKLLQRVLQALIDHCIGRCPPGETIRVEVSESDQGLTFRVSDGGPAFAPGYTPSFLADTIALPRPAQGGFRSDEGLGLYFAGLAARALGAQLAVRAPDETAGPGVVFEITLPVNLESR